MIKFLRFLRDSRPITLGYVFFSLSWCVIGITLLVTRILESTHILNAFIATMLFFTTQSNILVVIILLLFLFNFSSKRWFIHLSFICLVNISITSLVFNILLGPNMDSLNLIQYVLHVIVPILYLIFYYVFIHTEIPLKRFYIGIIYPLIYLISIYTWIEPIFGDKIEDSLENFNVSRYVYMFLDPSNFSLGLLGSIGFNLFILGGLIALLSLLLNFLKIKLTQILKTK